MQGFLPVYCVAGLLIIVCSLNLYKSTDVQQFKWFLVSFLLPGIVIVFLFAFGSSGWNIPWYAGIVEVILFPFFMVIQLIYMRLKKVRLKKRA